jgi:predicted secreted protein
MFFSTLFKIIFTIYLTIVWYIVWKFLPSAVRSGLWGALVPKGWRSHATQQFQIQNYFDPKTVENYHAYITLSIQCIFY